ncbi:BRCA1-A complex subunit RAP80 isoform X2 [Hippocampus zosterae]|uniref:BRCA1-A complex subunit RAP80 isoform X2 n=1 Tax=Hippocampus zosterae TaxID=109293 RepID=UPI00223E4815|nr:BRCA1-A complex subunit RAP80 isoform X2 [Hippocampus zosterae]
MVRPSKMPQKKQSNRGGPPESQSLDRDSEEEDADTDDEQQDECSTSLLTPSLSDREKRWRERKCKARCKVSTSEMTEEEMMALALHLSAQEANVGAQQEDAALMKAIKESLFSQRRELSQSQSLLTEADTIFSQRGHSYSNGMAELRNNLTASENVCTTLSREVDGNGGTQRGQTWKSKESPLAGLSQSTNICTQALASSSESALEFLDSPQSCDSTHIDDQPLPKSPVFALSGRQARVTSPQLSQNTPESYKSPSYALCSQPSPARGKSPLFSESDTGDECAKYCKSAAFGDESRCDGFLDGEASSPDGPNSDFIFSSQESSSPSARPSSYPPMSLVFPRSPAPSKNSTLPKSSLLLSGTDGKHAQDAQSTNVDRNPFLGVADDSSETELTSDMTLRWSDEDADQTLVSSPSPVYPDEKRFEQAEAQAAHLNQVTEAALETNGSSCSVNTQQSVPAPSLVHYYWGVPFCPRGLDADAYTQVIVAQMELYEKSLKEAQRCLLRKAEWGDAIVPQLEKSPLSDSSHAKPPRRLGLRRKDAKLSGQEGDNLLLEEEDEEKKKEEDQKVEEEMAEETAQTDFDVCAVCPGTSRTALGTNFSSRVSKTQMSEDDHTDLSKPSSPEFPAPAASDDDQAAEEEKTMDGKTLFFDQSSECSYAEKGAFNLIAFSADGEAQKKHLAASDMGRNPAPTNEEEESELGRSRSPEPQPAGFEAAVECPICQGTFPAGRIERHAAYCDGEVETSAMDDLMLADERSQAAFLKPKRKRKRWAAEEEGDAAASDTIQEKCYICQKAVALCDYSEHTDLCIQRRAAKTPGKGNLLAALEHVESRHAGAGTSRCRLQQGDVIDLRDDNEEAGVSTLAVSNSPIKSFTPISEATDCLVDFRRQQWPKKPSHKRR